MNWILPGTVLEMDREEADQAEARISALFLAGGMVLSQVTDLTGLEPYTVQNWVKRGFLPPPVRKRYSRRQLCRIINDEKYQSRDGTPKQQLWHELMDILVRHPESITSIRIDSVIRNGIKRFPQEQGRWWCMFAEYYNRLNNNEKARDMWAIPAVLKRS